MTPHPESAKSRTLALPNIAKGTLTVRQGGTKTQAASVGADNLWSGIVFSPYLVPLSRRVE